MLLPFVRELFADVEKLSAFARVASHLREGTGRTRVSGLTPTAKALLLVLWRRRAERLIVGPDKLQPPVKSADEEADSKTILELSRMPSRPLLLP